MLRKRCLPLLVLALVTAFGCTGSHNKPAELKPPEVDVTYPIAREITDYEVFTGRTEAVKSIDVRARVTGYLDKIFFKDGDFVKQGDDLFEIDPRTYKADLQRAAANLTQAEVHLRRLETDSQRAISLLPRRAISQEEYDKIIGDKMEAEAAVGLARASRDLSSLNVEFTRVKAPINGRISRRMMDPGNLIKADETTLTTIVSLDTIYAYFDVDERTLLRLRRMILAGKMPARKVEEIKIKLGLSDEEGFSIDGSLDFADNKVDAMTGTLRVRGLFTNTRLSTAGSQQNTAMLLSPGLFVRIRLPIGNPHTAILVPERALATDQGKKFLNVVNDKNEVDYRQVQVGSLQEGMRVIEDGLGLGEKVVVNGLQRARPGAKVNPTIVDTPPPGGVARPPLHTNKPAVGK